MTYLAKRIAASKKAARVVRQLRRDRRIGHEVPVSSVFCSVSGVERCRANQGLNGQPAQQLSRNKRAEMAAPALHLVPSEQLFAPSGPSNQLSTLPSVSAVPSARRSISSQVSGR
jgi:hypothetical protein